MRWLITCTIVAAGLNLLGLSCTQVMTTPLGDLPDLLAVRLFSRDSEGVVLRVVDGDTIEVDLGGRTETVRYIGVDTPETKHPTAGVECFGPEAAERNRTLVEGRRVRLVRDVSDRDPYGRLLRYVYLEDGTFVNEALVEEGYAEAVAFPPDTRFAAKLDAAEDRARAAGRGLWGVCHGS
jgi:micrococcal nuclease